jgi:hypothetical protein
VTAAGRAALIRGGVCLALAGAVLLVVSVGASWIVREHVGWPAGASTYVLQDVESGTVAAQGRLWVADAAATVAPSVIAVSVAALLAAAGRPVPVGPSGTASVPHSADPDAAGPLSGTVVVGEPAQPRRAEATSASTRDRRGHEDLDRYRPPPSRS